MKFLYYTFTQTLHISRMQHVQFLCFMQSLTGLNLDFFFSWTGSHTKVKEPSLLDYLPIAGERIIGFIPFPRVLALWEMQTASPGFELEYISYNNNHYTMSATHNYIYIYEMKERERDGKHMEIIIRIYRENQHVTENQA